VFILWHLGVAGRSVGSEALDEERHEDDEAHAHQQHGVPVRRDPLCDGEERLLVQQDVLQSDQRTLGINLSTFEEHVAVSLEVVARGAWS